MDTGQVWGRWPRARERTLARTHDCVPLRFSSFSTQRTSPAPLVNNNCAILL